MIEAVGIEVGIEVELEIELEIEVGTEAVMGIVETEEDGGTTGEAIEEHHGGMTTGTGWIVVGIAAATIVVIVGIVVIVIVAVGAVIVMIVEAIGEAAVTTEVVTGTSVGMTATASHRVTTGGTTRPPPGVAVRPPDETQTWKESCSETQKSAQSLVESTSISMTTFLLRPPPTTETSHMPSRRSPRLSCLSSSLPT